MSKTAIIIGPYENSELVFLKAVTNLHPGIGRTGEVVDLPVQKDDLGFPIIYSSSLKGALKSILWTICKENRELVKILFGPDPEDSEKFMSAIAILDALTIAFPIRSLEGVYAFATSPLLLKRLNEYLRITGASYQFLEKLSNLLINNGECQTEKNAVGLLGIEAIGNKFLINEEICVKPKTDHPDDIEKLEQFLGIETGRFILLSDDDALRALEKSLVRVTRIALDRDTKTVKTGALWTEEYVPLNTIFCTVFLYSRVRKSESPLQSAIDVKNKFHELANKTGNYLIIGGDETTGRGIVKLEFKQNTV